MARSDPLLKAKPLLRAMALQCAEPYCEKYGLSVEKLKSQEFAVILGTIFFAQPTGIEPDGLRNDLATVPYPTLIMRLDEDGKICFQETAYTRQYIANRPRTSANRNRPPRCTRGGLRLAWPLLFLRETS